MKTTKEKIIEISKKTGWSAILINYKYYVLRNKDQIIEMVESGVEFKIIRMGTK